MTCFNHKESSAVGTCKSCFRFLCQDCVYVDADNSIICNTDSCRANNQLYCEVMGKSKNAFLVTTKSQRWVSSFLLSFGLAFLFFAILDIFHTGESFANLFISFNFFIGGVFAFFGLGLFLLAGRYSQKNR